MRIKKPEVNRFFRKGQYKTYDKSLFHKWLKEEGYSRYGLAIDLDVTVCTIDRYMREPERLTLKQVKVISEETQVDANFIMNLIYENS
tara:strand:+ start:66 stop:329 length:264 start_codon:yes stop_codon:yes gene_type:complete